MPKLRLDADARRGVQAFADLEKAIDRVDDKLEVTAKEAKKLEVAAGRVARQNEEPLERYNRKVAETAVLVKRGKLSHEEAAIAVDRYRKQMERAGQASSRAFGAQAIVNLAQMATGYLSVTSAVGVLTQALRGAEQASQAVADSFFNGLGAIGELQQVSNSPEEFQANVGYAVSLVSRGIVKDFAQAADISFATDAAGYSASDREFLAQVGAKKQVAGEKLVGYAQNLGKVRSLYGGKISLEGAADKLTLGAENIITGGFAETGAAVSEYAAASQALEFSGDAGLAGLVMVENESKNIDVAGTQMKALYSAIDSRGLNRGTLRSSLLGISEQIAGGKTANDVLGNVRAIAAYRAITGDIGRFDKLVAEMASSDGALASRDFMGSNPLTSSAAFKETQEGLLTADKLKRTPIENLLDAMVARSTVGKNAIDEWGIRGDAALADMTGTEEAYIRRNLHYRSEEFQKAMLEELRKIKENTAGGTTTTRQE